MEINLYPHRVIQRHLTQPVIGDTWYAPLTGFVVTITGLTMSMINIKKGRIYKETLISRSEFFSYNIIPIKLLGEESLGTAFIKNDPWSGSSDRTIEDVKRDPKTGDELSVKFYNFDKEYKTIVIGEVNNDSVGYYVAGSLLHVSRKGFYSWLKSLHSVKFVDNEL